MMATQLPPHNSDEDDDDYVPHAEHEDEKSDEEPESKRPRVSPPRESTLTEAEKQQYSISQTRKVMTQRFCRAKDALWASFQAAVSSGPSTQPATIKDMVKVEKRFRYAGETVVCDLNVLPLVLLLTRLAREVVEVAADSPDAKKWPLWHEKGDNQITPGPSSPAELKSGEVPLEAPSESSSSTKPAVERPGPRKSKTVLAAIPTQKAKKLSTLEKSAMDWQAHVQASGESGLKDELEAHRRGGGYLEKVEFLNRVEERKEGVIEANKGSKRRRN
ncbi:hypothetical protein C0993_001193 [Termitomyces sp. T159_Od127]|nr:hypothetical protein C0993_001193 [Termitomyces sp. T159_Od127]